MEINVKKDRLERMKIEKEKHPILDTSLTRRKLSKLRTLGVKMRFNIWTIINTVFYYCSLFAMVFIIIKTDWNSLESLEVFYICGTLGGIMYLGDILERNND